MKMLAMFAALWTAAAVPASTAPGTSQDKPGKEHEALKVFEGEWTFEGKFFQNPDQPATQMKGTESSKLIVGGYYLNSEVKATLLGLPFEGRWTMTYSAFKKKYQASWIDSMMPHVFLSEGDVDATGKIYTLRGEGFDPATGKATKERWVVEVKDADTHVMTFYGPGDDGKEKKTGELTYTRKK